MATISKSMSVTVLESLATSVAAKAIIPLELTCRSTCLGDTRKPRKGNTLRNPKSPCASLPPNPGSTETNLPNDVVSMLISVASVTSTIIIITATVTGCRIF